MLKSAKKSTNFASGGKFKIENIIMVCGCFAYSSTYIAKKNIRRAIKISNFLS